MGFYPIVGTPPIAYSKVWRIVGGVIGKKIVAKQKPFEEAVESFSKMLFSGEGKPDGKRLDGQVGNPNVLE